MEHLKYWYAAKSIQVTTMLYSVRGFSCNMDDVTRRLVEYQDWYVCLTVKMLRLWLAAWCMWNDIAENDMWDDIRLICIIEYFVKKARFYISLARKWSTLSTWRYTKITLMRKMQTTGSWIRMVWTASNLDLLDLKSPFDVTQKHALWGEF